MSGASGIAGAGAAAGALARSLVLAERLSRALVVAGGLLTLASVLLIGFDVVARKFFGFSTGGADELSSYAFAIGTTWAMATAALQRAHVRVDVVYQMLPLRLAAALDWLALVALGVFAAVLAWYAFDVMQASWSARSTANTPLATPLWIPQGMWFGGLAWFVVVLGLMLLRASHLLVRGDLQALQALCGVRSSVEEAADEAEAGARLVQAEREQASSAGASR